MGIKTIWILNHYASSDYVDKGGRHYWIAKYLKRCGYAPVVFCSNKVHNTDFFCFDNGKMANYACESEIQVPFVFIKGRDYKGNGRDRILNMCDFYFNVKRVAKRYANAHGKPDIIYASSVHPLTLVAGIQLAKHFGIKCVCEVRDLWPESIVAMGVASEKNPIIQMLYRLEKWCYKSCDALITTFEGGYDYIEDKGYSSVVPKDKYYYVNNGVDLEEYDSNARQYVLKDDALESTDTFKAFYTGSLRLANGLEQLLDCAFLLKSYPDIQFYIFGAGDYAEEIERRIVEEGLQNVHFKGNVKKKYVPYLLSKSSINILNYNLSASAAGLYKYGSSQNKLFEYLASGKPVVSNMSIKYDLIQRYKCGISRTMTDAKSYAQAIIELYEAPQYEYSQMCENARIAAQHYDFKEHTNAVISILESVAQKE